MEYQERLGVPLRWWVQGTMLVATFWLAMVVALPGVLAWTFSGLALAAMALMLVSYGAACISVSDGIFRAGRARIEAVHLGPATALDPAETRRAAGPEADARAYLLLRPYLKRSVRVPVTDPRDPTPYWLIATRHPDALVRALRALETSE